MSRTGPIRAGKPCGWNEVPSKLRATGMRWTPQRRTLVGVLSAITGHVSAAELIERCRELDPTTTPSTVYRTLDVLEELGLVRHGHDLAGREEYHVLPEADHGHLYCQACGHVWEIRDDEAEAMLSRFEADLGFSIALSHVTISGRCKACRQSPAEETAADSPAGRPGPGG